MFGAFVALSDLPSCLSKLNGSRRLASQKGLRLRDSGDQLSIDLSAPCNLHSATACIAFVDAFEQGFPTVLFFCFTSFSHLCFFHLSLLWLTILLWGKYR